MELHFNYMVRRGGHRMRLKPLPASTSTTAGEMRYLNIGESLCGSGRQRGDRAWSSRTLHESTDRGPTA